MNQMFRAVRSKETGHLLTYGMHYIAQSYSDPYGSSDNYWLVKMRNNTWEVYFKSRFVDLGPLTRVLCKRVMRDAKKYNGKNC